MRIKRLILCLTAVFFGCLCGASLINAPVVAQAKSSFDGGHHAGGSGGLGYWKTLNGSSKKSAWQKFLHIPGSPKGNAAQVEYKNPGGYPGAGLGAKGLTLCKQSSWISYYANSSSGHGWATMANSSNKGHDVSRIGPGGVSWARKHGFNNGHYVIICSASTVHNNTPKPQKHPCKDKPGKPCHPCLTNCKPSSYTMTENSEQHRHFKFQKTIDGVYSSMTQLTPEKTDDYADYDDSQLTAWGLTHENQSTKYEKNAWSRWIDTLTKNSIDPYDKNVQTQLSNLGNKSNELKSGDYVAHPKIQMSTKNKRGFAEGGVIDLSELRKYASVTYYGEQSQTRQKYTNCVVHRNKSGKITSTDCYVSYGPWEVSSASINKENTETYAPYSYWQMINVRCAKGSFDDVASKIPGFKVTSHASSNGMGSSTGHTPIYKYATTDFGDRPLGNDTQDGVLENTAHDDFFEKPDSCEVPIDCSSVKQPSAENASKDNVRNTGTTTKANGRDTYGAQHKRFSAQDFTFFRDGRQHHVRTDLWYPTVPDHDNSGISFTKLLREAPTKEYPQGKIIKPLTPATKALYTRVLFDTDGTPREKQFGMRLSKNSDDVITGTDVANGEDYMDDNEDTDFYYHAIWPSNSKKPERMNVDWTWRPTVTTTMDDGLSVNPNNMATKTGDKGVKQDTQILATCPLRMNTIGTVHPSVINNYYYDKTLAPEYSGKDPLLELELPDLDSFNDDANAYVSVAFVRSTSDLH